MYTVIDHALNKTVLAAESRPIQSTQHSQNKNPPRTSIYLRIHKHGPEVELIIARNE